VNTILKIQFYIKIYINISCRETIVIPCANSVCGGYSFIFGANAEMLEQVGFELNAVQLSQIFCYDFFQVSETTPTIYFKYLKD
jgi:hypothetical protein